MAVAPQRSSRSNIRATIAHRLPYRQIRGRMSRTVASASSIELIDFCLIFVPFGHYDEPEILRYAITSIRPIGADGEQCPSLGELQT